MATDHYLPLFVGDMIAATAQWDGKERGMYVQFLMVEWASGPIENATKTAQFLGYSQEDFELLWPRVSAKFRRTSKGLINDTLEAHRKKSEQIQSARSKAGKRGSSARWSADDDDKSHSKIDVKADGKDDGNCQAFSNAIRSDPIRSVSNPYPINTSERARERPSGPDPPADPPLPSPEEILAEYPHSANGSAVAALRAIATLIGEGEATAQELLAATQRYARFVVAGGASGPKFVKAPQRFYARTQPNAPAPWSEPWEPPKSKAEQQQDRNVSVAQAWLQEQGHPP
jgi:uncharacterized protein YdaU (DUF1376 family)